MLLCTAYSPKMFQTILEFVIPVAISDFVQA